MNDVLLSVVIVAYKRPELVDHCLQSVFQNNDIGSALEVVLVDNGPGWEAAQVAERRYPDVRVIRNANNGFGGGNNVGARVSHGSFLCFLNPDTQLVEPIFSFAVDKFRKNSGLGMFGVRLISDESGRRGQSFYGVDTWGLAWSVVLKACNYFGWFVPEMMCTSGADIFVRSDVFARCGEFDEKIFMYYEEPDLTRRVRGLGYNNGYVHNRSILHLGGGSTESRAEAVARGAEAYRYYCEKFGISYEKMLRRQIRFHRLRAVLYGLANVGKRRKSLEAVQILIKALDPQRSENGY